MTQSNYRLNPLNKDDIKLIHWFDAWNIIQRLAPERRVSYIPYYFASLSVFDADKLAAYPETVAEIKRQAENRPDLEISPYVGLPWVELVLDKLHWATFVDDLSFRNNDLSIII